MPKDPKNKYNLRSRDKKDQQKKKKDEESRNRKNAESSDDDESEWEDYEENQEMDQKEYKKFLHKLFPSKALAKEIEKMEEIDANLPEPAQNKKMKVKSPSEKFKKIAQKASKKLKEESEEEEESEEDESEEEEESEEEDEEEEMGVEEIESLMSKSGKNFNIIFTIGDPRASKSEYYDDEEDEEYDEDEDEDEVEDEEEDDEEEEEDDEEDYEEEEEEEYEEEKRRSKSKKEKKIPDEEQISLDKKDLEFIEKFEEMVSDLRKSNKDSTALKDFEKITKTKKNEYLKKKEKSQKKQKEKNTKKFRKLLKQKNPMNDLGFFQKLESKDQEKILKDVEEINKLITIDKPYRMKLLESDIPPEFKACAMKKVAALRYMEPGGGEFHKLKTWVDTFMQIPFGKYASLPVSYGKDGKDKCHDFMSEAVATLDKAVYGLNDAKLQIMQMVGQWLSNPGAVGNAIAIKGPPGTGKTTLVKHGISKILNRDFAFLALGGATDSSFLEGHSYTYEGSTWGKIVDILVQSKCMNPVIYFDELDKISDSPKGEEITGILTHLTDTTQNDKFHDKYFSEIDFDLSKCLFIFSYNDESKINPILKDRMYRIETKGYESSQKMVIANKYLLPTIREQVCFNDKDIEITGEAMNYIMQTYCHNEKGVRNLKRCLEIIYTKLNLYRLMKDGTNLFEEDLSLKITFPVKVESEMIRKLIKKDDEPNWLSTLYI